MSVAGRQKYWSTCPKRLYHAGTLVMLYHHLHDLCHHHHHQLDTCECRLQGNRNIGELAPSSLAILAHWLYYIIVVIIIIIIIIITII